MFAPDDFLPLSPVRQTLSSIEDQMGLPAPNITSCNIANWDGARRTAATKPLTGGDIEEQRETKDDDARKNGI
ncbi:hypothetical protein GCK72_011277 [Caenorhabditis remanei]|uniref:Uncharacterized protein n=1 Tax=Caenorhabditis remanei TaxID=31234 RepID=A0A6A5H9C6_CAERE|nr:hypothetical protein GCK72_011277 [Caenorhabditis remanei]KAF1763012.1 hypothetical protein GCK72_011277 [Caenorhabditis remanei]